MGEATWSRFTPAYSKVKELLRNNAIGDVRAVNASFGEAFEDAEESRICKMSLGGGTILDLGIYCINLITWSFGDEKPESGRHLGLFMSRRGQTNPSPQS